MNVPAVFIVVLVTVLLVFGIQESVNVNTAIVFIKLGVIVTFILAGISHIHRAILASPDPAERRRIRTFWMERRFPRSRGGLCCLYRF